MSDDFTCSHCHETFTKAWSDEEAMAEAEENGFLDRGEELIYVCDDCYEKIMTAAARYVEAHKQDN